MNNDREVDGDGCTYVEIDLPSGAIHTLRLMPPMGKSYPEVEFSTDAVSVMDLPHLVSKLLEIHCAAVDALLVVAREGKNT